MLGQAPSRRRLPGCATILAQYRDGGENVTTCRIGGQSQESEPELSVPSNPVRLVPGESHIGDQE